MILSDRTIRERLKQGSLVIDPLDETAIQPSSVDLRLDSSFRLFLNHTAPAIDVRQEQTGLTREMTIPEGESFILHPREFVLAATVEKVEVPDDLVARLEGKSSLGRLGLIVHSTAGFVDAGFRGQLTLELLNVVGLPTVLYPGMRIAQIGFFQMTSQVERPYGDPEIGSKYQDQVGPTESRLYKEFP